jgi:hypothetical protein
MPIAAVQLPSGVVLWQRKKTTTEKSRRGPFVPLMQLAATVCRNSQPYLSQDFCRASIWHGMLLDFVPHADRQI